MSGGIFSKILFKRHLNEIHFINLKIKMSKHDTDGGA
jgi:hypothetical protein